MKRFVFLVAMLALLLSACGGQTPPTIDPVQVQASAMAAASTMIAQTQAAIPPTPIPTDTPQASPTPLASATPFTLPTSVLPSPTTSAASGDPCNAALPSSIPGPKVHIMIQNNSGAQVNISVYLDKTKFGQCGYRGYQLSRGAAVDTHDLVEGQYYLYVWINNPQHPKKLTGGGYVNGPLKYTFIIGTTNIQFVVP